LGFSCVSIPRPKRAAKKTPVTQPDKADPKLVTVIYPVADLVVPIVYNFDTPKTYDDSRNKADNAGAVQNDIAGIQPFKSLSGNTPDVTQEEALIRLICAVVDPESWRKKGTIEYTSQGMGLVVRQTQQVHEEIATFLAGLRRLQEVEVAIECRMVSVPEAVADKVFSDLNTPAKSKFTCLDDSERETLLKAFLSDKGTQLLQVPKITVFNGQRASICVTDYRFFLTGVSVNTANNQVFFTPNNQPYEVGFRSAICPTVSADRKNVLMDLQVKRKTVREPVALIPVQIPVPEITEDGKKKKNVETSIFQMFFQQPQFVTQMVEQKFSIPDGKTALIVAGKEKRQTALNANPDMVSQMLVWAGVLKEVTYSQEACINILLVTPRIIVNDEYKENFSNNKTRSTLRPLGN